MQNVYQFTRSIGFQLVGKDTNRLFSENPSKSDPNLLRDFVQQYRILLEIYEDAVFFETKEGEKVVRKSLYISFKWLKRYAREYYYAANFDRQKTKNFTIKDAEFLHDVFTDWKEKNQCIFDKISQIVDQPKECRVKESDLALLLRTLWGADYFLFIRDLVQYFKDKNTNHALEELKPMVELFQTLLEKTLFLLSPSQSSGTEIVRASFNAFTINKINKLNFDEKLEEKKKLLDSPYTGNLDKLDKLFLEKIGFIRHLKEETTIEGQPVYSSSDPSRISLQELYLGLKDFRAKQKKAFYEAIDNELWNIESVIDSEKKVAKAEPIKDIDLSSVVGKSFNGFGELGSFFGKQPNKSQSSNQFDDAEKKKRIKKFIQDTFPLFNANEDTLLRFVQLIEDIKQIGNEINQAKQSRDFSRKEDLSEEIGKKRTKKGQYFIGKFGFQDYSEHYCNKIYKKVAMAYGKLRAEIRGIEQERIEARLLRYWAHIVEQEDKRSLLLIPKEKMADAKKFLEGTNHAKNGDTLTTFNSLTLRALEKLIRKNYPTDIPAFNEDKVSFYKKALSKELPLIGINFSDFTDDIQKLVSKHYSSEEEFRTDMEKITYAITKRSLSKEDILVLENNYGSLRLDITSYDLEREISKEREHTQIWNKFWSSENQSQYFPVRLNPELRLFYRKAQSQEQKKQNNRFSKDHFRVSFTITQNAAQRELNTIFAEKKDLIDKITTFNQEVIGEFIEKNAENLHYFGIDRGNQELATLGVVKWSKEEYEATLSTGTVQRFSKPFFPEISVYQIKDQNSTKKIIIDAKGKEIEVKISVNPSYFMNDEEEITKYFKQKTASFIDLTTAKVIKGRIILDGDTSTYLNLKKANAKRRLFEVFPKIDPNSNVEFFENIEILSWDRKRKEWVNKEYRKVFIAKMDDNNKPNYQILCFYHPNQEKILSNNSMEVILQEYLEMLRTDSNRQEISIDEINHLRDAIAANMVGIIALLFKQFPSIINMENLHQENDIQRHFTSNNENIARRLEWALYRKFQKEGRVPPNLKQTIFLKDSKENLLNQFGIIHFIPTKDTSADCPYCGTKVEMGQREQDKFNEHAYICRNNPYCAFTTKNPKFPLEQIDNSDNVAAYNIAKRGLELILQNKQSIS